MKVWLNNNKVDKFGGSATDRKTAFEAYVKQEYLKVEERALNDADTLTDSCMMETSQ